jgi:hypothetical protein
MTENRVSAGYYAVAKTYAEQFCDELDHKPLERGLLGAFCDMTPRGAIADSVAAQDISPDSSHRGVSTSLGSTCRRR